MRSFKDKYSFSFIIIGRNEGWKLTNCINSVEDCVYKNDIVNYEVIYVDSNSSDDSIDRIISRDRVRVFSITGKCSAAVARNIGAKESNGDILFFLDGDMEIVPELISELFDDKQSLINPFITSIMHHKNYNSKWELIGHNNSHTITENKYIPMTGGFFIITKELWYEMNGMDTRLDVNEDIDLGLRLAKKGVFALLIAKIGVTHNTIPYEDRVIELIPRYKYPAQLFRKHWRNRYYLIMALRTRYTAIILFLSILMSPIFYGSILLYAMGVTLRACYKGLTRAPKRLVTTILRDTAFLISIIIFHPKINSLEYRKIEKGCY